MWKSTPSTLEDLTVIKLGGAALKSSLSDPALFRVLAQHRGPLLIVHGGGPEINQVSERLGLEARFHAGQRVTTPEVLEVVSWVLLGKINPALVRGLESAGRPACGLSGLDGSSLSCVVEDPHLGLVGRVERVRPEIFHKLLSQGFAPVVSPLGYFADGGGLCNINADLAAAALAKSLSARRLLFLTDRDGILDAHGSALASLSQADLEKLLRQGETVSGGMRVKARAILETLEANPACEIQVMNGLDAAALTQALSGAAGVGTRIATDESRGFK